MRVLSVLAFSALALIAGTASVMAKNPGKDLIGTNPLPSPTCAVSQQTLNSWKVTPSSQSLAFNPPNSVGFPTNNTFCDFYQWGASAFLWLTSTNSNGDYNFLGPNFFNVISVGGGNYTLEANMAGVANAVESKTVFRMRTDKPASADVGPDVSNVGQAGGGGVLMSQANSLVYYGIHVNDVFAGLSQFKSQVSYYKTNPDFPTQSGQVDDIETAAKTTYSDANALAMELKTSWVDAATLPSALLADMLTITAQVPNFVPQGTTSLVWDGETYVDKTLALVGMHLVGTVTNHPEMVWATFEHVANTQDNSYSYVNASNTLSTYSYNQNAPSSIFFKSGTAAGGGNVETMTAKAASQGLGITINAAAGSQIGPVATVRYNPWGNVQPTSPTTTDPVVVNNTDLLSLAVSLGETLLPAGVGGITRASYVQTGAIWTDGGVIPTFNNPPTFKGSTMLANSTMETFFQNPSNQLQCFSCHSVNSSSSPGTDVSHIFKHIVFPQVPKQ